MLEIDLSGQEAILTEGHSSKGNQPKWLLRGCWYKAVTNLYGSFLHFDISRRDIDGLFDGLDVYFPEEILNRVRAVLSEQMRKFAYLF